MKSAEITKKIPLELLCIRLLEERDMYGYEMVQEIKKRSDGLLELNITTLYLALKRLNEHRYVSMYYSDAEAARERSRIYYHLEPAAGEYQRKLEEEYEMVMLGVKRFLEFGQS
ncbi:MAG: helix-turn-helix transcriptional regulator [Acutalibacter sp.]|jgi:PadR family transcriptional regulator PadR|uniref:PadR family transcriptional regulator n=1 Tax=Acutalibacter sp. TaxID=1918636 RepID=UPI00216C5BA1|nr:PadR family transcriptional regulator [Acutalibacter sp.]MCI9225370.1 helix-turn-helix transcriptional regulator [Acutalibacter sp.]